MLQNIFVYTQLAKIEKKFLILSGRSGSTLSAGGDLQYTSDNPASNAEYLRSAHHMNYNISQYSQTISL